MLRLEERIKVAEKEKSDLQNRLNAKMKEAAETSRRLQASAERIAALESDVSERGKRVADLESRLKDTTGRVRALQSDLRASGQRGEKAMTQSRELADELAATKKRLQEAQKSARQVPTLRAELRAAKEQYADERAMSAALEKEVANRLRELKDAGKDVEMLQAARRSLQRDLDSRDQEVTRLQRGLAALQSEKKSLQQETARVRAAADNRFAGITLTGRRVVFLVDMSGSMELVDENTPAPGKWAEVGNTVARLMRSMPDLQKYQVIVFAEKAEFLFKGQADWLDYDASSSPQRVQRGLAAIKPTGGTNLYAALEAAFRMKAKGLDTIYLLSDGLPNLGAGLNPNTANSLTEVERNDLLAKHLRKTLQTDWNRARPGQPRVRINTIGFFFESPDVGAFLWALARENDGSFVGMSKP
jgi:predicted  nucleic acid-binding Zn-ribbon protein